MKTSSNGLKLIEQYEGLVLQSYDDATGKKVGRDGNVRGTLTIGYGHTSAAGSPTVVKGMTITRQQAEDILAKDLGKVENSVSNLVKVPLNQNQYDALVSFQFNTGSLGKSSALRFLNAGKYKEAAEALLLYNKGRVNGELTTMDGLVRRRSTEKALFLAPVKTLNGTVAAGTIAASTAGAAASAPHHLVPWIIGGGFILALVAFIAFDIYSYKQWKKNGTA